jgi:hypothetical protein
MAEKEKLIKRREAKEKRDVGHRRRRVQGCLAFIQFESQGE